MYAVQSTALCRRTVQIIVLRYVYLCMSFLLRGCAACEMRFALMQASVGGGACILFCDIIQVAF